MNLFQLLIKSQIIQSSLSREVRSQHSLAEARNLQRWRVHPHLSSLSVRKTSTSPLLHFSQLSPSSLIVVSLCPQPTIPSSSFVFFKWKGWRENVLLQCLKGQGDRAQSRTSSNKLKIENLWEKKMGHVWTHAATCAIKGGGAQRGGWVFGWQHSSQWLKGLHFFFIF